MIGPTVQGVVDRTKAGVRVFVELLALRICTEEQLDMGIILGEPQVKLLAFLRTGVEVANGNIVLL